MNIPELELLNLSSLQVNIANAFNIASLVLIVIPGLILSVLCVLVLLYAKSLNLNIRITLLSIFVAQVTECVGVLVVFLGYPIREVNGVSIDYSCHFAFSCLLASSFSKVPAIATYAIVVYIFIKSGAKKVKLYATLISVFLLWAASILFGLTAYFGGFVIISNYGFCQIHFLPALPVVSASLLTILMLTGAIALCLTLIFGILTFCYMKKNLIQENASTKRAVTKILLYNIAGAFITLLLNILPSIFPVLRSRLEGRLGLPGILPVLQYYFLYCVLIPPLLLSPLITMSLLKPVQQTLREIIGRICRVCRLGSTGTGTAQAAGTGTAQAAGTSTFIHTASTTAMVTTALDETDDIRAGALSNGSMEVINREE